MTCNNMAIGYSKQSKLPFPIILEKTKAALAEQGFGIITEIDVKATLKKKLDVDFENYVILGACSPKTAMEVLLEDREMGLLLPCNVIVYEKDRKVTISAILPSAVIGLVGNPKLSQFARNIEEKLISAVREVQE